MARLSRSSIFAEYWHIMLRGTGHMDLFLCDADYVRFRETLCRFTGELSIPLYAYCLMSNHVHLLLRAGTDSMALLLKKTEVSYAHYFRQKYEHTGHLFQNRYISQPVQDERYFLAVYRYILRNPEAAGICGWEDYPWSNAVEIQNNTEFGIADNVFIMGLVGNEKILRSFVSSSKSSGKAGQCMADRISIDGHEILMPEEIEVSEPEMMGFAVSDGEVGKEICRIAGCDTPLYLKTLRRPERDNILAAVKSRGFPIRQIERVTGINRNVIQRARVKNESSETSP